MTETLSKAASPSQGAREIATELLRLTARGELIWNCKNTEAIAALIDAELAEVMPYMRHKRDCSKRSNGGWLTATLGCTCGLAALLERFTPGK